MSATAPVLHTDIPGLERFRTGKVRDVYAAGDGLVIVATDRISAFDYVLGSGIPDKGRILTQLSAFWFDHLRDIVPNHVISLDPRSTRRRRGRPRRHPPGRSMLVRRTTPVPIECVARGYLAGSGWKEYTRTGTVCGIPLPAGLREADRLPAPIFTPATKAESGHDENISAARAAALVGAEAISFLERVTLALYERAAAHAESRGIILADTKFEFGWTGAPGESPLMLIDEAVTPDSSRFWPRDGYRPVGRSPATTSSSSATTSRRSAGTSSRQSRRYPKTWCGARARSTSRRSGG